MIGWEMDEAGIVTLTMDDPTQGANTMNALFISSLATTLDRLEAEKEKINGVVITSAKKTFFAGGDLHDLIRATPADAQQMTERFAADQVRSCAAWRRWAGPSSPRSTARRSAAGSRSRWRATTGSPSTSAARRSASPRSPSACSPAAAGVVRTVRMFGIQTALMEHLLQGQRRKPADALKARVVDELVGTREELIHAAKTWALTNLDVVQPWDVKGYKIPGGTPIDPGVRRQPAGLPGQPAQAAQGRPDARTAPHHGRGRRGRPGRLRHRGADRDAVLRRPRDRSGQQEHDQGVLLRPPAHQQGRRPAQGLPEVHRPEGRRARRRDDGRGHRLRVRPRRHGGRAQGREPGRRGEGQGLLAGICSTRPWPAAG